MHLVENQAHSEFELLALLHKEGQRTRVRFADCVVDHSGHSRAPGRSEPSIDEIRSRWYSHADFQRFKQTAQLISRESQASPLVSLMRESYCATQHQLDLWSVHGRSLRGLEHMVNQAHGDRRKMNLRSNHDAVFDAQERFRKSGLDNASMIAEAASEVSKPAREFATRMGLADFRALLQDCHSPLALPARRQSSYIPRPERPPCLTEWSRRPSQITLTSLQPSKPCL